MRRRSYSAALVLVAACSVDAGDPFGGVMSGSASATATASGSASATDSTSATGAETEDAPTDGDETETSTASAESTGTTGEDSGTTGSASETTPTTTGIATDATATMSSSDTSGSSDSGSELCGGGALDGELDVPPGCDATCTSIGYGGPECPGSEICRLKDTTTGVCESCVACGNLHDPCAATIDCDILFTCFLGQCTAMCDLNTPQTCGNPAACTNVGHPTHGVCDPNL